LCGFAAFAASGAGTQAQEAPAAAPPVLEEVVVSGLRASLREALEVKMNSDLVVDAISSEDIGQLPDVTIAESINRLPGINATRDRGNDSQAVVRGLGARLVLGTVNGREVASSEPDRNVRWEIYPSEVVSGVQVYKTQSADLIAGGVAGTINISTIQPLDYTGPAFVVRGGPVYYESGADIPNYEPWGYRGSASFVHNSSDKFGIVLGVTAQQQKNGYPSFTGWGYNDAPAGGRERLHGRSQRRRRAGRHSLGLADFREPHRSAAHGLFVGHAVAPHRAIRAEARCPVLQSRYSREPGPDGLWLEQLGQLG
jgi:TonB-dependent receptor